MQHAGSRGTDDRLAIDFDMRRERLDAWQYIGSGSQFQGHRGDRMFGLLRTESASHLGVLKIAGAPVVDDDEAADSSKGLIGGSIAQRGFEDGPEFEFVIEGFGEGIR